MGTSSKVAKAIKAVKSVKKAVKKAACWAARRVASMVVKRAAWMVEW